VNTNAKKPIVYVSRDIERALGKKPTDDYFIVTNKTKYSDSISNLYPKNVILVDAGTLLDTYELLERPDVAEIIQKHDAEILVFQNTSRIERLVKEKGWTLLNPSAKTSKTIEEKISQVSWLGKLAHYLPPHKITTIEKISFNGERFILQFNHSHTGEGTFVIENEEHLSNLREKFPKRECRTVSYIDGSVYTVNTVVADNILVGNVSFQITGISPFTDLPLSTIGNDWKMPYIALKKSQGAEIEKIAREIGERLKSYDWLGLFGIDIIIEKTTGNIFLLEINARQPASTTFESQLQKKKGDGLTIFDAHIRAIRNETIDTKLQVIRDGAQIIQRITKDRNKNTLNINKEKLSKIGCEIITYDNVENNKDLVRITSPHGIMSTPNTLNEYGEIIASSLS